MTDIIELAEAALATGKPGRQGFTGITRKLVAELKAVRAENERMQSQNLIQERRVMTPQGRTFKPVGIDEVLGDRLRGLGWKIESRYVTDWVER